MSRDFFLGVYSNGGRVWRWALFIVLCALVLSGWRLRMDNSPEIWLPSGDPEVELYDRFKEHFGNDSFVAVVSQKFDPKSTELALELGGRLEALEGVASLQSPFAEDGALKDDVLSQRLIGADGQRFAFLVALPVGADPGEILRLLERVWRIPYCIMKITSEPWFIYCENYRKRSRPLLFSAPLVLCMDRQKKCQLQRPPP